MGLRSPIATRTLLFVFAVVLAMVGINQISPIGAIDPGEPLLHCHGMSNEDSSAGVNAVYGTYVKCAAGGGGATVLRWPDGMQTGLQNTRIPLFVGDGAIELLDAEQTVLASLAIRVEPDISVECSDRDSEPKKVFALEATELRSQGWDYVFTNIETGETVRPGDAQHPNGGNEDGLERVLLDEAQSTGLCRLVSQAGEDFDSDYLLEVESPWEATQSTPLRIIGPSSKTQWAGTQPAVVTGTVTVNNITASERVDVYQSGCS